MPGKHARRYFSQLREFERGLIIGMKTEDWSTRLVAGQVECAVRNSWEQWTREDTLQKQILNPSVLSVHSLKHQNIGNCVYSGVKPDQCGMSHIGKRMCLVMNPDLFWGQMITVYGLEAAWTFPKWSPRGNFPDNARPHTARVAQDFLRHFQTLPCPTRSSNLSPVEHVWDKLKRQMPSCYSVHDLELVVQDLWAHMSQDNIRCLINSMPDRVAACIAAGGGPTCLRSCPVFVSLHTLYSFYCLVFEIK
ncbi:uncharacterized protein TNCV_1972861 [Trichonephila clavipes]|nr:uncharacterized protein TNCV_1972861 [Trichonephila clavipes]